MTKEKSVHFSPSLSTPLLSSPKKISTSVFIETPKTPTTTENSENFKILLGSPLSPKAALGKYAQKLISENNKRSKRSAIDTLILDDDNELALSCLSEDEEKSISELQAYRIRTLMAHIKLRLINELAVSEDDLTISLAENDDDFANPHFVVTRNNGDKFHIKTPLHPSISKTSPFIEAATYDMLELLGYAPKNYSFVIPDAEGNRPVNNLMIVTADVANKMKGQEREFKTNEEEFFGSFDNDFESQDPEPEQDDESYKTHYATIYIVSTILGLSNVGNNPNNVGDRTTQEHEIIKREPFIVDFNNPPQLGTDVNSSNSSNDVISTLREDFTTALTTGTVQNDYFEYKPFSFDKNILRDSVKRLQNGRTSNDLDSEKFSLRNAFFAAFDEDLIKQKYTNSIGDKNLQLIEEYKRQVTDRIHAFGEMPEKLGFITKEERLLDFTIPSETQSQNIVADGETQPVPSADISSSSKDPIKSLHLELGIMDLPLGH